MLFSLMSSLLLEISFSLQNHQKSAIITIIVIAIIAPRDDVGPVCSRSSTASETGLSLVSEEVC